MHEMSLAMNIVDIACTKATEAGGTAIREIEVEVGRLAGVMVESLSFCFSAATHGTMAEGAELRIIDTPAEAECMECRTKFAIESCWGRCPSCDSWRLDVLKGRELRVLSITFDE